MYDFHKIKEETCENCFFHCQFQRGKIELLQNIKRKNAFSAENGESVPCQSEKTKLTREELEKTIVDLNERLRMLEEKDRNFEEIRNKIK